MQHPIHINTNSGTHTYLLHDTTNGAYPSCVVEHAQMYLSRACLLSPFPHAAIGPRASLQPPRASCRGGIAAVSKGKLPPVAPKHTETPSIIGAAKPTRAATQRSWHNTIHTHNLIININMAGEGGGGQAAPPCLHHSRRGKMWSLPQQQSDPGNRCPGHGRSDGNTQKA